ncbi:kinase-like protein, partial [Rickenella mellea]
EAEIWSRLDHPHVLQFLGICQIGPIMYLASPWQSNGNMSEYLKVYPDFDRYTLAMAGAVNYLHLNEPSIVHGDIKGSNIMISARGEPLLCDFGLSIILSEIPFIEDVPSGLHDAGRYVLPLIVNDSNCLINFQLLPSLRYSAPELLVGNGAEDLKTRESDTFAFAMLIIEASIVLATYPTRIN